MQFIVPMQSRAADIPTAYIVPSCKRLAVGTHAGYKAEEPSKPRWCFNVLSWAIENEAKKYNTGAAFPPSPKVLGFHAVIRMKISNQLNAERKSSDLAVRTKAFALSIIQLFKTLPNGVETMVMGKQLLRCGTSVGAQYREAKRARSKIEFQSKLEGAMQELEESEYWLELLLESKTISIESYQPLSRERNEIMSMLVASAKTSKANDER